MEPGYVEQQLTITVAQPGCRVLNGLHGDVAARSAPVVLLRIPLSSRWRIRIRTVFRSRDSRSLARPDGKRLTAHDALPGGPWRRRRPIGASAPGACCRDRIAASTSRGCTP